MVQDDRGAIAGAILAVASAAIVFWQNARLTILWDLSYILENASRIAAGDVPYRDFPFPYAPGTFVLQAAIIRIFGRAVFHHTIYAAVACAIATALTFALVRHLTRSTPLTTILALPLALLGIYCIFPHPFYDPDCCLAIIAIVAGLMCARSGRALFIAAMFVPVTLLIKQNIGVGFVAGFILWIVASRERRTIAAGFGGLAAGGALVAALIAIVFGLHDYIAWTVRFAASRRLPSIDQQLAPFGDVVIWYSAGSIVGGLVVARVNRFVGAVLMAAPWIWVVADFFITNDPVEPEINFLRTWPIVMVVSIAVMFMRRDRDWRTRALPALIVVTIYGVFLSQGTWGSTYGIWPLLIVLIATWMPLSPYPAILASILTATIFFGAVPYVRDSERLTYVKLDGDMRTSSLAPLRGLRVAGEWLPEFEELVSWTNVNVPRTDGIVCLPGEDLFYFTTGRRPRFPVLMFDRTVNPFTPSEIVQRIAQQHIRWIIVKKRLQLNGTPMEHLDDVLRALPLHVAARLRNYDVYRVF